MGHFDVWIARQSRRLSLGVFLATLADALAVFLLVFGTAVLLVKLARPEWWPSVLWLAGVVVPVSLGAWWLGRGRGFSRTQAVALLDRQVGADGLLMTLSERSDGTWARVLSDRHPDWEAGLPRVRPVRAMRRLWLPAVFVLGCCVVPARPARTETVRTNVVGRQVTESLTETLEVLRENEIVDLKEAEELQQAIEKLANESQATPLSHESWEVVDALNAKMRARTDESLMAARKAQDALAQLAADAGKADAPLSNDRREQLERETAESLRKLAKQGKFARASPKLQARLRALLKDKRAGLPKDPKARETMLSDLKDFLDKESKKLSECRGNCDGDVCGTNPSECKSGRPGRGGVNRGRADAELTWGDEAQADGAKFKEVVLPPQSPDQPNKEVVRQSASAPEVAPAASAPRGAARAAGPETGRQAWNRALRPKHRAAVRSYFDTPGR